MINTIKESIRRRLGIESPAPVVAMEDAPIENVNQWSGRYSRWKSNENLTNYPFVANKYAPFAPMRRALPMLNMALISTAGAYIEGTDPFDSAAGDGDANFREIPVEVGPEGLRYAARGYDPAAVQQDRNVQIPIKRLEDYSANAVIGRLNEVWWSFSGFIPNARLVADELAPRMVERLHRYEVQAALIVPASRLCHQSAAILARIVEQSGIPTMMLAVDKAAVEMTRPPRAAYYDGQFGSVVGPPNRKYYQLRVLDEAMRWIESFDQPTAKKLVVDLETEVEESRGEE